MITAQPAQPAAITLPKTIRRIVLTGFMGAGKTTIGRLLAERLQWTFLDLDHHLETRAGATIPDLFTLHGEPAFRRLESRALASALTQTQTVLALGGGVPEQLTNRLLLEQTPGTPIVFLEASFETLYDRCMIQSFASPTHIRPLLASPAEAQVRFLARAPHYRRLARLTLPTANLTPEQAALTLLDQLSTLA